MKHRCARSFDVSPLFVCALTGLVPAADLRVEVEAGRHPRRDTPVFIDLAAPAARAALVETTGGREKAVPAQVDGPRVHWILQGETKPGSSRQFRLALLDGPSDAGAAAGPLAIEDVSGKHLEVRLGGRSVLRYNYGLVPPPEPGINPLHARNGYLHPLWSPAGLPLTMDYPRNHLHHRGVWSPWVKTEFEGRDPDFWNLGDGKGRVEFEALEGKQSGPVFAGFKARHRHVDLKAPGGPKAVLIERWSARVWRMGSGSLSIDGPAAEQGATERGATERAAGDRASYFLFDLDIDHECAGSSPLKLPQYRYGGLGIRGSWDWEGDNVRVFTSEGKGRLNAEGANARWFDLSGPVGGPVNGKWAGIAVLGHPENFRAPQPVRSHPSEPFMNFAPVKAGDFEIAPGKPYRARYRFYLHDGVLHADEAERLWIDYAEPPVVRLKS